MSTTVKIPIDAIKIPDVRASSKLTPEQLEFFKATVEAVGIIQDPVVRQVEPGNRSSARACRSISIYI